MNTVHRELLPGYFTPPKLAVGQGSAREHRVLQIIIMLLEHERARHERLWFGTYELARACGMKPTTHFRTILRYAYEQGLLLNQGGNARNGVYKDVWMIADNARHTEPYRSWIEEIRTLQETGYDAREIELFS